jgi:hypothetical protein
MYDKGAPTVSTEQVEALLKQKLGGRIWNIRLVIEDGGIVLQGHTSSYYAKQLAQHAAMEVLQLPIRANLIEVH